MSNRTIRVGRKLAQSEKVAIYESEDGKLAYKFTDHDNYYEYQMMNFCKSNYTVPPIKYIENMNCIVMPVYTDGDSLTLYENNQLDEPTIKRIIYYVLQCLAYFQSIKIIHNDIKPDNIFIKKTEEGILAFVGDFEYAECVPLDYSNNDEGKGTIYYMSPEKLLGNEYSYSSDLWSVGVCMKVFFSKSWPFNGNDAQSMIRSIKETTVTLPNEISEEAKDLLNKLLCINPTLRITAADALQHAWFDELRNN